MKTHYRTHTCGQLRIEDCGKTVTLSGWVNKAREMGGLLFLDIRDRYGVTQLTFDGTKNPNILEQARDCKREFVIRISGNVIKRSNPNGQLPTGDIEIDVSELETLRTAQTPPFTIEKETDGGEDLRMEYRFLDLRRPNIQENIIFRSKVNTAIRRFLSDQGFLDIETPYLIKSTPEGARDFVVPSRMNPGEYYALPQSPQTFKQTLMISGFDRYYQVVKCFRDEDLRSDRQPEFTQVDCEMSFVNQEDILTTFEHMMRSVVEEVSGTTLPVFPRITYANAMHDYGIDKPDMRFEMKLQYLKSIVPEGKFQVFDDCESIIGLVVKGAASWSRKQIDAWVKKVQTPQIAAKGLVHIKYQTDGSTKSSIDKMYSLEDILNICHSVGATPGDLVFILCGGLAKTQKQAGTLRLLLAEELGYLQEETYAPLWVVDFPLFEKDEETGKLHAMHHPFTSPKEEDIHLLETAPDRVRANAYDMVINGAELGGGSIRIHHKEMQADMFSHLGFTPEEAEKQFGFLMNAFQYGAPPHGGIAFGLDRICAILRHQTSIRDFIAFPKNNQGRDVMIKAPSTLSVDQMNELGLSPNILS